VPRWTSTARLNHRHSKERLHKVWGRGRGRGRHLDDQFECSIKSHSTTVNRWMGGGGVPRRTSSSPRLLLLDPVGEASRVEVPDDC
jgi:hypothetical protein